MGHQIDSLDRQILNMIANNARIPFLEVARVCNVSGAAIHQRIQKLTEYGIIKGSEFILDPLKVGLDTCAFVGIYLKDPNDFESVKEALNKIPEVVECYYTTGEYDLFVKTANATPVTSWTSSTTSSSPLASLAPTPSSATARSSSGRCLSPRMLIEFSPRLSHQQAHL